MTLLILLIALTIGSFLNVCIYRIPRKESISFPPSHCPTCEHRLGVWDMIPLFSFVVLKGKCRYCKAKISPQYPIVEMLTALITLLLFFEYGLSIAFIKYTLLSMILIVVSFIDYYHKIIPNRIIVFGLVSGLLINIFYNYRVSLLDGFIGLLVGGGIFLIIAIVTKGAMGGGDIKLMAVIGFWLGWRLVLLTSLLSFFIGALVSIVLLASKIKGRKDYIPFGPFISIGGLISLYTGVEIISWYVGKL